MGEIEGEGTEERKRVKREAWQDKETIDEARKAHASTASCLSTFATVPTDPALSRVARACGVASSVL